MNLKSRRTGVAHLYNQRKAKIVASKLWDVDADTALTPEDNPDAYAEVANGRAVDDIPIILGDDLFFCLCTSIVMRRVCLCARSTVC